MADEFLRLIGIMRKLRSPEGGCPWDRQQTHESLRPYLIEETYEVLDSIDRGAYAELKKELGDLLLHIVFHAQLANEANLFSMRHVLEGINEKLIHRHPHVFGDGKVETTDDVNRQWERIKLNEKHKPKLLDGVPKHQPALNRAFRVQEKAAAVGFDWPSAEPVWDKLDEEIAELKHEVKTGDQHKMAAEFGDLLFSMVNLGRKLGIHPEESLRLAISKFTTRFRYIEEALEKAGIDIYKCSLEEMDRLWEAAKQHREEEHH
ncbi:nucleoside triphosphate pyrophosphohydrolase [bacterium]|nr:nucleoside triphosphate pyrophosphohydrolase [bacterium]MBU1636876.1 nucleoside triphosphate pyrophosphohydrolase [bacterium]MBU1920174.1 nucleoside triphosphate pyrophosphohydrolase [bacterium]